MARERRDTKNRILQKDEYQKPDGRYMFRYVDSYGEEHRIYSWTLTASDRTPKGKTRGPSLREMEREIQRDLLDGIDTFQAGKITLNAQFDRYMEDKQELKPSTRTNYKYMFDKYVRPEFGKKLIAEIKYSDVKRFYNSLLERGFKPNSLETIHTILHPVFTIAVRDGLIRVNPSDNVMKDIKKSHVWDKPKRHALTEAQQAVFMDYIKKNKTYRHWVPLFTVLLGTGCRVGEVTGLRWDDCDFENDIININHNLVYRVDEYTHQCGFYVTTPKTRSGIREIPMFSAVKDALLSEYEKQLKSGFNQSVIDGFSGFVFANRNQEVLSPHNINRAIDRICRDYNEEELARARVERRDPLLLPHFSVHNLRHTFCTRMCENESNIKIIQEIMGHADIATTMDIYNEATMDKKRESFSNLEGIIRL